jgi:hypothetical protein
VRRPLLATCLLLIAPAAARGQVVEITPVAGLRFGGGFSTAGIEPTDPAVDYQLEDAAAFGVHLGFRVARDGEVEFLYSRQRTSLARDGLFSGEPLFDLALETWQAGGNYLFAEEDARLRPYIGLGLGITRLLPEPADLRDETRFCATAAAGVKIWLGRHLGLRLEARGFFTVLESDTDTFCHTGEGCLLRATGSDVSQGEVRAGVALRF